MFEERKVAQNLNLEAPVGRQTDKVETTAMLPRRGTASAGLRAEEAVLPSESTHGFGTKYLQGSYAVASEEDAKGRGWFDPQCCKPGQVVVMLVEEKMSLGTGQRRSGE